MSIPIDDLKRQVFGRFMELAGRAFVVVRHGEDVLIGKRGFLPEEKERGLVLVFSEKMRYQWGDDGIEARLSFGRKHEQCYIPNEAVTAIYSPELGAQFVVTGEAAEVRPMPGGETGAASAPVAAEPKDGPVAAAPVAAREKVIKVDFSRRRP
jgi:hypothetical protein